MNERILKILKDVAYGEMASDEMDTRCLHCSEEQPYSADINVQHSVDCPVTLARTLLQEQGMPLYLYQVVQEEVAPGRDTWRDETYLRFAFSEDELRSQFPKRLNRKNRRMCNVRITKLELAK